ncbi:MAG TPA: alkaline phosphatase family protein, partial [Pyrinomonadaceae bacterium]|nr:alkaline phosphatase family protein [Pyrinomonadaceae bacterium]
MRAHTPQRRVFAVLVCLLVLAHVCSVTPHEAAGSSSHLTQRSSPATARRALVVSLDGLDARYLRRADEFGLKIPTLRRLMREGVWAEGVVGVYPTVTYPSHTTLVTGARPARHGIYG